MKFFNWIQCKFNVGGPHNQRANTVSSNHDTKLGIPREELSDAPHDGLLSIGTFGDSDLSDKIRDEQVPEDETGCSAPDLSEFTVEIKKLRKALTKLVSREPVSKREEPVDAFLDCPSSSEVDRSVSNRFGTIWDDKEEDEIDRTIRVILGRCNSILSEKKNATGKLKSLSFLLKEMFMCRSGLAPTPSLRDTLQESRMEKLLKMMLTKKIYPQNSFRASSSKKCIKDCRHTPKHEEDDEARVKFQRGSKWDKTDSEYIVLEI